MTGSRFRTTVVSLALLAVLAAVAYFTGGFPASGGPHPRPSDHSSAPRTEHPLPPAESSPTPGPAGTLPDRTVTPGQADTGTTASIPAGENVGFASPRKLEQHYQKHGGEFGSIGMEEYLRRARALRDRPAGGGVLECLRDDGVTTRYDRASGAFLAFNPDRTIRTFFRPNDGEAYFHRQCERGRP